MKKIVQGYDYPFQSPESFDIDAVPDDVVTEIFINGKMPAVILIPDSLDPQGNPNDENPIAITFDDCAAELRLRKTINRDQENWGMVLAVEDIRGEYTYSIFQLKITSSDDSKLPLNNKIKNLENEFDPELVTQFATKFIHKFIEAYKEINRSSKDWFPEISPAVLCPWYKMKAINKNNECIWGFGVYDCRSTGNSIGNDLATSKISLLQQACSRNYLGDTAMKYMQMANRYKFNHDYHSFCVFAVIAFKHWVFREIRKTLINKGATHNEIDDLFMTKTKSGLRNIPREEAIKLATGNKNFKNHTSYKKFIEIVLEKRDSIVHGRKEIITESRAHEMTEIISQLMRYISKEINTSPQKSI